MAELQPTEFLEVGDGHRLALYRKGNPEGEKVIVCHGGPGGNIRDTSFSFFDLFKFDVIAFDQRGCGKSTPFASIEANTVDHLVADMEKIREHYGIEKWSIFGGSFGTTLALSYAIAHPDRVKAMALRGIFLGRKEDIRWLYQEGASYFYPENFEAYRNFLPREKWDDIVAGYEEIFQKGTKEQIEEASTHWAGWEMGLVRLHPPKPDFQKKPKPVDISLARLECYYFSHGLGWTNDNYILDNVDKIRDIKTVIVHGRYDVDCRPSGAWELAKEMDNCDIYLPVAGHGANDLDYNQELIRAVNALLSEGRFYHLWAEAKEFEALEKKTQVSHPAFGDVKVGDVMVFKNKATLQKLRLEVKRIEDGTLYFDKKAE
ncbi:MAG: prolyl aminopeptidase [Tissierellia bacterium]|nr:prolyl aminopeptidase [Tissierellia bacterium]